MGKAWLGALLLLLVCSSARAQPKLPPRMSDRGRHMLEGALGGSWSNEDEPGPFDRAPVWSAYAQPSWVYFVRDRVGVGAYLGYRIARVSTGIDRETWLQASASPSRDSGAQAWKGPLQHDLSAGISAAFELFESGRLSLFARPYVGVSVYFREVRALRYTDSPFDPVGLASRRRHDARAQLGLRLPLVYQVSSAIGLGFGPDLLWENLAGGFDNVRLGVSSWLARTF